MKLRYLLDTNICIYIIKQKPVSVLHRFEKLIVGEVGMSTITYGELYYGVQKSQHHTKSLKILEEILSLVPAFPIPTEAAKHYCEVRCKLEKSSTPIGNNDLWIAAHALALNLTLVTNNTKEFKRISHLKVENWGELN
ncbi:MAG: type II toxin-antitoxin system VapC family toxin [Gammaproteobacteria bacterium]